MPRDDEREDAEIASDRPMTRQHDVQTRREQIAAGTPKQMGEPSGTRANSDLAAYRSRIEEQLAARRMACAGNVPPNLPMKVDASSDASSVRRAMARLKTSGDSLFAIWIWLIVPPFALCLVAGSALWWSLRADSGPAKELAQALQQERSKSERLSREVTAAWHQVTVQAAAQVDRVVLEQETRDLRQALQHAEESATEREQTLAQERERGRQLDRQLAMRRDTSAAERAAQQRDAAALQQSLKQAQELAATHERSLAQERLRGDRLESELRDQRQALNVAEERGGALEQQLAEERSHGPRLEEQPAVAQQTVAAAIDEPATSDKPVQAAVAVAPDDGDLSRLMQRARLLVSQGNIGAARSVLERAAETDSGPALFALAETFDPVVLAAWGTVGTQGDLAHARDLYARALAGGVLEARERLAAAGR